MATIDPDLDSVVIDANIAVAWVIDRPYSAQAMAFVDAKRTLFAPDLLVPEAGNALSYYVRIGVISPVQAMEGYRLITSMLEFVPAMELNFHALDISMQTGHSIYDCFYLALASLRGLCVVSADRRLNALAAPLGIATLELTGS
jgi:predicted nucleic acid-binding protein